MTKSKSSVSKVERSSKKAFLAIFKGKKEQWLPLFQRLLIRFEKLRGIELVVFRSGIGVLVGLSKPTRIGMLKIDSRGIKVLFKISPKLFLSPKAQLRLKLVRNKKSGFMTHETRLRKISDVDEELLSWLNAAAHSARISKRQSA